MYWEGNCYVDLAFAFGVARTPNIFNRRGGLLEWIFGVSDSVNEEDIQKITCKGIQKAINKIMRLGRGTLIAKFDLSRAYCCFPICESHTCR